MPNKVQILALILIIGGFWIKIAPFEVGHYSSEYIQSLWPYIAGFGIGAFVSNIGVD